MSASKLYVLFFLTGAATAGTAQSAADSLWAVWRDAGQADTVRLGSVQRLAYLFVHNNPDSARSLAQLQLDFAREKKLPGWEARALNSIGLCYRFQGEYDRAFQYYEQSIALMEESGERQHLSAVYGNMGDVYRLRSNFPKAIECLTKAQALAEEMHDVKRMADICIGIATIYYDGPGNTEKTLEYLEKALGLYTTLHNEAGISLVYANLTSVYLDRNDLEQALVYAEKGLAMQERLGNLYGAATSLHNRATIYTLQGRLTEALADFNRAVDIYKTLGDQEGLADAYNGIGDLWIKLKKYPAAIGICRRALDIAREIGSPNLREADACQCLYRAYEQQGNYRLAFRYLEQHLVAKDSLQRSETAEKLQQMELERQAATDSLEREKEKFRIEIGHQQAMRRKDRTLGLLAAGGLGAIVVALAFWLRMLYFRRRSQRLQSRSEDLEKQQLLNEIALLRSQVNPHFLFNSLSILSSLVHDDPDLSERYIEQLARSYRYILEQKDQSLVPLRTELEFIRSYVFLLKIRFADKFDLRIDLPEDAADRYRIAPLTLQLLVENSVKHNRMSPAEPLVVEIRINEPELTLTVKNRLQPRSSHPASTGIGLKNIFSRYALLTDRPVRAGEEGGLFVVKVPLLP